MIIVEGSEVKMTISFQKHISTSRDISHSDISNASGEFSSRFSQHECVWCLSEKTGQEGVVTAVKMSVLNAFGRELNHI